MPEKSMTEAAPSSDRMKAKMSPRQRRENLASNIAREVKGGIGERQARMAHAYLLQKLGLARDANEIMGILGCAPKDITDAGKLATENSDAGVAFRTLIQKIEDDGTGSGNASAQNSDAGVEESIEEKLQRLAKKHFDPVPKGLAANSHVRPERLARWAIMHIAFYTLKKTLMEAAQIAGITNESFARRTRKEAEEEYAAKDVFYREVGAVREELGFTK